MDLETIFNKGMSYTAYRNYIDVLFAEGNATGAEQTKEKISFTKLNVQRMQRWDKTVECAPALVLEVQRLSSPQKWLVITEGWCGDSAQSLPILAKIAAASGGKIELRIIGRDENPEVMDQYLTNGSRAIPKLVVLDQFFREKAVWGPRPAPGQELLLHWKANQATITHDDFERDLHAWYAKDKGLTLQEEMIALMNNI
jgi:Thioredoxin